MGWSADAIITCRLCNLLISVEFIVFSLSNNKINARALIGQSAMVYCASKLMENRSSR